MLAVSVLLTLLATLKNLLAGKVVRAVRLKEAAIRLMVWRPS